MNGYVLAGGAGRRMGADKATTVLAGLPMGVIVARRLSGLVDGVHLVGGRGIAGSGLAVVPDLWPGEGPLAGIVTALHHADADALVVACDMPLITRSSLRDLVDAHRSAPEGSLVTLAVAAGVRQPLLAVYRGAALAPLRRAFEAGERAPTRALDALLATEVPVTAEAATSVDTPTDVRATEGRVRGWGSPDEAGATGDRSTSMSEPTEVPEIDVEELAGRRQRGEGALLDVRQPDEYAEGHVPGAVLVPLDQLPDRLHDVPAGEPLHVICRSGGRSLLAAELLRQHGRDAVNVAGGTMAWIEGGHDVESGG